MHPPLAPRSRQGAAQSGRAASPRSRLQEPGTPAPTSTHSQQRSGRPRRTTSTPLEEPTETAMPPAPAPAAPAPAPEPEPPAGASMTAARSLPFGPSGRSLPAEVTTAVADAARPAGMADYLALASEQGLELRRSSRGSVTSDGFYGVSAANGAFFAAHVDRSGAHVSLGPYQSAVEAAFMLARAKAADDADGDAADRLAAAASPSRLPAWPRRPLNRSPGAPAATLPIRADAVHQRGIAPDAAVVLSRSWEAVNLSQIHAADPFDSAHSALSAYDASAKAIANELGQTGPGSPGVDTFIDASPPLCLRLARTTDSVIEGNPFLSLLVGRARHIVGRRFPAFHRQFPSKVRAPHPPSRDMISPWRDVAPVREIAPSS